MTTGSPWFRSSGQPGAEPIPQEQGAGPYEQQPPYETPHEAPYEQRQPYGYEQQGPYPYPYQAEPSYESAYGDRPGYPYGTEAPAYEARRAPGARPEPEAPRGPEAPRETSHEPIREPYGAGETRELPEVAEAAPRPVDPLPGPGRAERRRAAAKQGRGKSRRGAAPAPGAGGRPGGDAAQRPLSRVEARRAAREAKAAKDSVGVVVGELFITLGV
ncbi:class E sortase, partial [Streptomyces sp. NPDC058052]